jgi:hypothetical protein
MNWAFWKKKEPEPAVDLDQLTLEQLAKTGADLSREREAIFYLYVPEGAAEGAAGELRAGGFDVEAGPSAGEDEARWCVTAVKVMRVDAATIAAERRRFEELAARHGGDFDGWEAAV